MINRFGSLLVNRNVVICYIGAKPPSRFFTPSLRLLGTDGAGWREFCTQQNSTIFGLLRKRCSYAGERRKMAPQVPQSAQLAYSLDNLMVFEPSRAPLEPSGCEPDHFKALKPDQNGRRGGQIALLDGKKRNRTAPKAILPAYERHRVIRFAPRGAQGRPGGPQNLQIPLVIC